MKKGCLAVGILFAIDVAVTAAFVAMMPDQIPVHFSGGTVDRIGSRYETFTVVARAFVFGLFMLLLTRFGEESNRKVMTKLNIGMQALFIALSVFISLNALSYDPSSIAVGTADGAMSKIAAITIGATLLFLGFLMPKATRNSTFGIRLPWTQKSDEAWRKGQRFGAYASVPAGVLMIICGMLLDGDLAFIAAAIVFVVWALVSIIGSYFVCKDVEG